MNRLKNIKPREIICFSPIEIPIEKERVFIFIAIDVASEYAFNIGHELICGPEEVLKHIGLLMLDKKFNIHSGQAFQLIVPSKYESLRNQIEMYIKPLGGTMVLDEDFLIKTMAPLILHMQENMNKRKS